MTHRKCAVTFWALWLTLLFDAPGTYAATPADSTANTAVEPVQAIWKQQEISFYFQSFTTFYSCSGLESKVERIMRELGAHAKVRVRSVDCPSSVARMPRVVMDVIAPVQATPEALAERDKNKSVRELAQRVKGKNRKSDRFESLEPFPAQWRRVDLSRGRLNLEPGDCELVEELQKKVLPKLAVRVLSDRLQCSPNQLTLGQPRLEVEALIEMPRADEPSAKQPGA